MGFYDYLKVYEKIKVDQRNKHLAQEMTKKQIMEAHNVLQKLIPTE
jgi:hypothetical protein